jgi:hypothetical protein
MRFDSDYISTQHNHTSLDSVQGGTRFERNPLALNSIKMCNSHVGYWFLFLVRMACGTRSRSFGHYIAEHSIYQSERERSVCAYRARWCEVGLEAGVSIPEKSKISWDPLSLLSRGCLLIPSFAYSRQNVNLISHLNLMPKLRTAGSIISLPTYAFNEWCLDAGETLQFSYGQGSRPSHVFRKKGGGLWEQSLMLCSRLPVWLSLDLPHLSQDSHPFVHGLCSPL